MDHGIMVVQKRIVKCIVMCTYTYGLDAIVEYASEEHLADENGNIKRDRKSKLFFFFFLLFIPWQISQSIDKNCVYKREKKNPIQMSV